MRAAVGSVILPPLTPAPSNFQHHEHIHDQRELERAERKTEAAIRRPHGRRFDLRRRQGRRAATPCKNASVARATRSSARSRRCELRRRGAPDFSAGLGVLWDSGKGAGAFKKGRCPQAGDHERHSAQHSRSERVDCSGAETWTRKPGKPLLERWRSARSICRLPRGTAKMSEIHRLTPRLPHLRDADNGRGIDGVFAVCDGGDVEDGIRLGQRVVAGVIRKRAFVACLCVAARRRRNGSRGST